MRLLPWVVMLLAGCSADDTAFDAGAAPDVGAPWPRDIVAADAAPPTAPGVDLARESRLEAGAGSGHRGIWVWGSSVRGHEVELASWLAQHRFTDIFVLIKGTSGIIKLDVLDALLKLRPKVPGLRVWAWMVGFNDASHADPSWSYLVGSWVSPSSSSYRAHLAATARKAADPALKQVSAVPDGVMLDDSFQWPSQSYGSSTAQRVQTLMAAVDAIAAELAAITRSTGQPIRLGFAPHPETSTIGGSGGARLSVAAVAYGQDFGELARRCDWIVPETYRYGFYGGNAGWIGKVVSDIRAEISLECPARAAVVEVYPALVLYQSDSQPAAVSVADLVADRAAALAAAGGYSIFRYASSSVNPGNHADGHDWPSAGQLAALAP